MAINLNSGSAQAAVDSVKSAEQNKNKVADGFEDGDLLDFDDLMNQYNQTNFGTSTDANATQQGSQDLSGTLPSNGAASSSNAIAFGQGMNGLNINSQLGQVQQAPPAPPKITVTDVLEEGTITAVKATDSVLKSFVKSLAGVTFDDFASLSMDIVILGGAFSIIGGILSLTGIIGANTVLKAFGRTLLPSGLFDCGFGMIGIGLTGFNILNQNEPETTLNNIPDTPCQVEGQSLSMDTLDAEYDALLDSFWDDEDDDIDSEVEDDNFFNITPSTPSATELSDFFNSDTPSAESKSVDNQDILSGLSDKVAKIDRTYLLDQFSKFLPKNCSTFGKTQEVDKNSTEFDTVRSLLLQALSNVSKIPIEELPVDLEKLESSAFSYTMTVGRLKGLSKLQDLADEIQIYFRENASDTSVIANVEVEHGYYKISLTKGISEMVTVRDCLEQPEVRKYFENTNNLLPFIAGIDTYGKPILASGENYTAMLTAGKQRSGKSWYIASVLMTFMTFNLPTDVQFLFIDPKKSSLYRTFSCMPHTIGVHDDEDIIDLLKYIINVEGERRKERLRAANKGYGVDSIRDYRKEGYNDMPYLYIVIDEFLTAIANAEARGQKKEFNQLIAMIITQLPFVGIHIWLVPHRAQGAVDKTTRANMMFTSAFRCENSIVKEVLETEWTRPLKNPGDMAIKLQDIGKEAFARAAVFTTSDDDNKTVIMDIAKAWYKIGASVPNVDYGRLANKDFNYIGAVLNLDDNQTRTLKLAASGGVEDLSDKIEGAGLMDSSSFAMTHRQTHNTLEDILDVSDDTLCGQSDIETSYNQSGTETEELTDEDEEMLARWRKTISNEEENTETNADLWEDASNIFNDIDNSDTLSEINNTGLTDDWEEEPDLFND